MKNMSKPKRNQGVEGDEDLRFNPYLARRLRQKLAAMTIPRPRLKPTLAFMFMPQFRNSIQGFLHLYPVFVRMVAVLLAECTLIPENHPALRYNRPDEKTSYSFKQLVGDAWFTLKTTRASAFQWGMFSAVVMMIVTMLGAVGALFSRVVIGVGAVAQAQVFNVFQAPVDPYPGQGSTNPHDWSSINGGTAALAAPPAGTLFDQRVQGTGVSQDYAMMVLDKVLRQSMASTQNGGALQNALQELMLVYNTGMLVIAGIMVGWLVMSLIIDTAKTGQIGGGGRHNMVWLPIRIMFAIGIMFPLGSVGYSGGQYMVVKLAEWGSNFGSQGWNRYVAAVVGNQQLLAPYSVRNSANIVNGLTKIMVCQVAYNTYVQQRTGALPADQAIGAKQDDPNGTEIYVRNRYTNDTGPNICGSVSYGSNATADTYQKQMNWDATAAGSTFRMTASTPRNTAPDNFYKNAPLATAVGNFRFAMRNAVAAELAPGGPATTAAMTFACQFVARRYHTGDAASTAGNPVADIPECPGATAAAADPAINFMGTMQANLQQAMMDAYTTGGGQAALQNYIGTGAPGSPMIVEMTRRGWAGMGMWYQDIVSLNNIMLSARTPPATIEPGSAWVGQVGGGWEDRCQGGSNKNAQGENCKYPGINDKVLQIMQDYDRWWEISSMVTDPGKGGVKGTANRNEEMARPASADVSGIISSIASMAYGDNGIVNIFLRLLFPRSTDTFIFKAVDLNATRTYPLTQLADTGHTVLGLGLSMWTLITIFQSVSTIDTPLFSAGKGLAFSALMQILASLGSIMIFTGMLISFYLPALPFIRVAFAVLTWITSVFEAVVMVPVAALTHLSTTGPGLMGDHGRLAWVMWFNLFLRPILVVFGFISGMLIFNAFAGYFHTVFDQGVSTILNSSSYFSPAAHMAKVCYSVVYVSTLYSVANSTFKLMDVLPNHVGRWMGSWGGGGGAQNMDPGHIGRGLGFAGAQFMEQMKDAVPGTAIAQFKSTRVDWDGSKATNILNRADGMLRATEEYALKQAAADKVWTMARLNTNEKAEFQNLNSERDRNRYLQHKFLQKQNQNYNKFFFERGIGASVGHGGEGMGFMGRHASANPNARWYNPDRLTGGLWTAMRDPSSWTLANTVGSSRRGAIDGNSNYGYGRYGSADRNLKFRALDGQLAGATFGDKALDKALSMGNSTHTSNWDDLNADQRAAVTRRVENQMSSADALNYAKMSAEDKMEFVQAFFDADPLEFAPGVGKDGVLKMVDYLKNADQLQNNKEELQKANKLMGMMTRHERADVAKQFLAWSKQNNVGGGDPSVMMGQLAGAAMADKALDKALGETSKDPKDLSDEEKLARAQNEMTQKERLAFNNLAPDAQKFLMDVRLTQSYQRDLMNKGYMSADDFRTSVTTSDALLRSTGLVFDDGPPPTGKGKTIEEEQKEFKDWSREYAKNNFTPEEREVYDRQNAQRRQYVADIKSAENIQKSDYAGGAIDEPTFRTNMQRIHDDIMNFDSRNPEADPNYGKPVVAKMRPDGKTDLFYEDGTPVPEKSYMSPEVKAAAEERVKYSEENFTSDEREVYDRQQGNRKQYVADIKSAEVGWRRDYESGNIDEDQFRRNMFGIHEAIINYDKNNPPPDADNKDPRDTTPKK